MAQRLQNISIAAPAFKGLNTQDSPLSGDSQYASVVDNAVVDSYGRIGARKGLELLTTDNTLFGSSKPTVIHEYEAADTSTTVFSIVNGKILTGTTTLSEVTPSSYTINNEKFQVVNFNDKCYFFNKGYMPLVYDDTNGMQKMDATTSFSGTAPQGNIALAGFGRLWVAGVDGQPNIVYWSDLLIGEAWDTGSSGSLNLDKVWADGADKVTALAIWNNYLIIFGYNSIVMYQGADDPASMVLADTVSGAGCVERDTVRATGTDLLFLSARGLMSLGRTIQEKSNPINDVSKNVRDDLIYLWQNENDHVKSVYSAINSFYLLIFPTNNTIFCFDTRGLLENGAYRVTRWVTDKHYTFCSRQDDTLLIGNDDGINKYATYNDNADSYRLRYYSNPLSFGDPSTVKFLKKIVPTIIGGSGVEASIQWAYDFSNDFRAQAIVLGTGTAAYYGASEFNDGSEFTASVSLLTQKRINTSGSGNLITVGLECDVNGGALSLQEFNIHAMIGRIY
jgi:hypothetical protein